MIGVRPRRLLFIFCAAAILVAFTRSIPHRLPFRRSGPPTSHSRSRLAAASYNASYTPQLLDDDIVKALEAQLLALASQGTLPKRGLLTDVRRIVQMSRPPDPDDDHLDTSWSRLNPDWGYEVRLGPCLFGNPLRRPTAAYVRCYDPRLPRNRLHRCASGLDAL